MKPYQVHLFSDADKIPDALPVEPIFVYENKRYLNFYTFDCYHFKNSEILKGVAQTSIASHGIASSDKRVEEHDALETAMSDMKKAGSILLFLDEIAAFYAVFTIFGEKATFFIDYETSPAIHAVLQHRSVEYYSHRDLDQLDKLLSAKSEKVLVIDGMYEWLGSVCPVTNLLRVAIANECFIIGNEVNSFGLLGRDGRGFIDLYNCYEDINIDIGSYSKFLGGFGCYIGAKKYLINKIKDNVEGLLVSLPQFMLSVNRESLDFIKHKKGARWHKLWQNSRYFITRLKQLGFVSSSETPIVVVSFKNNEEAGEFTKRLFFEQVIVAQNKERIRLCLSIEHSKDDLDFCLAKFESIGRELGITDSH
jgi:glycine C-acetyltransferase